MLSRVADLIEANADAMAGAWVEGLERRDNRLASQDNRRQLLNDAIKWITALLRSLRDKDFDPMFRTSPLIAQRLALSGFPASDVVEAFVVFKYVLWRLLRKANQRGEIELAKTVEHLEIFFDRIINGVVEEYERTWQPPPAEAAAVRRAKHLSVRAEEEAILSRSAREMAGERRLDRLLELILTSAANLVGASQGFAALTDEGGLLRHCAGRRLSLLRLQEWAGSHADALAELAASEGTPRVVADVSAESSAGLRLLGETLHGQSALLVPLRSHRGVIGYLALFDRVGGEAWSERDLALAAQVAAQGAESLEEATARRDVEERAEQLALLNEIGRALSWHLSPTNLIELAAARAAELLRARSSIVWLRDSGREFRPRAAHNLTLPSHDLSFTRGAGVLGRSLARDEPSIVSGQEAEAKPLSALGIRTALLVPIHHGKRHIGLLTVHDKEDGAFTENDVQLAGALENQLSTALVNAELYQESKRLSDKLQSSTAALGSALSAALDLDDLLQLIADHGLELANARACSVLFSEDSRLERRGAAFPDDEDPLDLGDDLERGVAAHAMEAGEPQALAVASSPLLKADKARLTGAGVRSCLALPLVIKGEPLGAMLVWDRRARGVSSDERGLLESFSRQAAVGIENVLLFETIQKRVVELMDLSWVGEQMISTLDEPTVIETVVRGLARALDREIAGVAFLDNGRELRIPERGCVGPCEITQTTVPFGADACVCHRVVAEGRPVTVDDAEALQPYSDPLMSAVGARSFACAPLTSREGTFGLIFVGDTAVRPVRPHQEALLLAYAGQAALALENAKHYRDVVRRATDLETLLDVTRSLSSTLDLEQTLDNVLRAAADLLQVPVCSILLLDEQTGELAAEATYGIDREHLLHGPLRLGDGIAGTVARTGMAIASRDLSRDGRFKAREAARQEGLASMLAVPLISKGRTLGVLNIYTRTPRDFSPDEQALVFTLASEACMAIENARLYREARQQARSMRHVMEEVNHRIKNNLQTIIGLMHLYMAEHSDPATCEALREIVGRIQAIAVVHELLLDTDITAICAKEASQRILDNVRQSMAGPNLKVCGQVVGAAVRLPSRKATALASAINELITNAVKHGFAGRREGNIFISLQEGAGKVLVQVRDDGVGLPEGFDPSRDAKLGLRIVQGIVEQDLEGEFTLSIDGGTTARITFAK